MSTHFSIYYHSPENKEYLRQIIESSGTGQILESNDLDHLPTQTVNGPDVVLVEYQENSPELDHWIEKTAANPKNPAIFLYFKEISTNNLWKALRLGAKECFTFPIQEENFQQAVARIMARTEARKGLARPTQVISFLGCKGGVGTTFLVANIASLLAQERRGKVLAVDLDLGYGQLNYFFDIHPGHTITEVVENLERLDKFYLQNILYPIRDNCSILAAPARLEEAEVINAGHLDKIIHYLSENLGFRSILIDCCHQIDEITLKALELSEILVLVTAQSIPALSNAKKLLEILSLLGLKGLEVEIWVNFWERQNELTLADVEGFLGQSIAGTISCDYQQVGSSINEGKPLVEGTPRHPICGDLKLLAGSFRKQDLPEATNGSRWKWLRRIWRKE
jgi:pilus assembly protein CpaE